jgi:UDP-D-galactose:(glucosyl)LPS alpha-1,3-D-galactosyltransferase
MEVSLAFDRAFAPYAAATMNSVLDRGLAGDGQISWWLLPGADVPQQTLDAIVRQAERRGAAQVLRVPTELDALPLSAWRMMSSRITTAAYYRLLLPDLLPESVERVLYLDSDLLCTGDLTPLWEIDLQGNLLGAVVDTASATVGAASGLPGFKPDNGRRLTFWSDYFNSGVLLIDVAQCRSEKIAEQSLEYIHENAGRLRFAVQDAMNVAVDDRWLRLDTRWNDMVFFREGGDVPESEIIHFAGPKKPWQDRFPDNEVKALYQKYLHQSA